MKAYAAGMLILLACMIAALVCCEAERQRIAGECEQMRSESISLGTVHSVYRMAFTEGACWDSQHPTERDVLGAARRSLAEDRSRGLVP